MPKRGKSRQVIKRSLPDPITSVTQEVKGTKRKITSESPSLVLKIPRLHLPERYSGFYADKYGAKAKDKPTPSVADSHPSETAHQLSQHLARPLEMDELQSIKQNVRTWKPPLKNSGNEASLKNTKPEKTEKVRKNSEDKITHHSQSTIVSAIESDVDKNVPTKSDTEKTYHNTKTTESLVGKEQAEDESLSDLFSRTCPSWLDHTTIDLDESVVGDSQSDSETCPTYKLNISQGNVIKTHEAVTVLENKDHLKKSHLRDRVLSEDQDEMTVQRFVPETNLDEMSVDILGENEEVILVGTHLSETLPAHKLESADDRQSSLPVIPSSLTQSSDPAEKGIGEGKSSATENNFRKEQIHTSQSPKPCQDEESLLLLVGSDEQSIKDSKTFSNGSQFQVRKPGEQTKSDFQSNSSQMIDSSSLNENVVESSTNMTERSSQLSESSLQSVHILDDDDAISAVTPKCPNMSKDKVETNKQCDNAPLEIPLSGEKFAMEAQTSDADGIIRENEMINSPSVDKVESNKCEYKAMPPDTEMSPKNKNDKMQLMKFLEELMSPRKVKEDGDGKTLSSPLPTSNQQTTVSEELLIAITDPRDEVTDDENIITRYSDINDSDSQKHEYKLDTKKQPLKENICLEALIIPETGINELETGIASLTSVRIRTYDHENNECLQANISNRTDGFSCDNKEPAATAPLASDTYQTSRVLGEKDELVPPKTVGKLQNTSDAQGLNQSECIINHNVQDNPHFETCIQAKDKSLNEADNNIQSATLLPHSIEYEARRLQSALPSDDEKTDVGNFPTDVKEKRNPYYFDMDHDLDFFSSSQQLEIENEFKELANQHIPRNIPNKRVVEPKTVTTVSKESQVPPFHVPITPTMFPLNWMKKVEDNKQKLRSVVQELSKLNNVMNKVRHDLWPNKKPPEGSSSAMLAPSAPGPSRGPSASRTSGPWARGPTKY